MVAHKTTTKMYIYELEYRAIDTEDADGRAYYYHKSIQSALERAKDIMPITMDRDLLKMERTELSQLNYLKYNGEFLMHSKAFTEHNKYFPFAITRKILND